MAAGAAAVGAGAAGTAGAGAAGAGAAQAAQAALFASPGTSPPAMLTVVLRARAAELARLVEQADTPAEGAAGPAAMARWDGVPPHKVNACYDPQQNALLLPAAMLQPPLCPATDGAAGLFGGLGAVVAHEMTHGFDGTGACACTCACTYASGAHAHAHYCGAQAASTTSAAHCPTGGRRRRRASSSGGWWSRCARK